MRKLNSTILLVLFMHILGTKAFAVKIDGIYYDLGGTTASVYNGDVLVPNYSGNVAIPESVYYNGTTYTVTTICEKAFYGSKVTKVIIPKTVTLIGENAFQNCSMLESISIDAENTKYDSRNDCNAVIETATNALIIGCNNTVIPNSVTRIGECAFVGSGLRSITIPNSVKLIGDGAFDNCSQLIDVISEMPTPPIIAENTFSNRAYATLYVPYGCKSAYVTAPYWYQFKDIVEMEEPEKCATPTIAFANGQLSFECETEGVEFVTSISIADMENSNKIDLFSVYRFSVYAKKEGYTDSDVAMVNIDLNRLKGDMNNDGIISISDAVALVNIILGGVSGSARYYSVGLDPVTAENYTNANDAHQVSSLNAIPSTLLTVTTPGVYYILLPDQFEPEVGDVVFFNVTKLNVTIPGYSVYRTTTLSTGVQIKRVNIGTSGSQIDNE